MLYFSHCVSTKNSSHICKGDEALTQYIHDRVKLGLTVFDEAAVDPILRLLDMLRNQLRESCDDQIIAMQREDCPIKSS